MASDAQKFAEQAIEFEKKRKYEAAIYFYGQAAEVILDAIEAGQLDHQLRQNADAYANRAHMLKKLRELLFHYLKFGISAVGGRLWYMRHIEMAESIRLTISCVTDIFCENEANARNAQEPSQVHDLSRAEFLLYQALNEDEDGNAGEAVDLYAQAVALCLEARKSCDNAELYAKLNRLAEQALERAEHLKSQQKSRRSSQASSVSSASKSVNSPTASASNLSSPEALDRILPDLRDLQLPSTENDSSLSPAMFFHEGASVSPNTARKLVVSGKSGYTKEELEVLRITSVINRREYVPFMDVDLHEKFAFVMPYTDKDGLLPLAAKQKQLLKKWARPEEFVEHPSIIEKVDSGTIKQTIISDCSFIASLAIAARYERRYNKKLVTSIIYPQNRRGEPVYNPCGKYMVKLNLNGVARKVVIDDYLPLGQYGDFLCSYSQHRGELWVSLLEKTYMKVMGGYDFPGSNSNIDLHVLTGWIPERIAIRPKAPDFNKDGIFEKLFDRYHKGDCLVTIATGSLPQAEQDRAGLVELHAYAMLDIRKVQDKRLFLLKNPWTHLRWKGRYSERDISSWTPELCNALDYNPKDAQQFDDGVFWIDYESICHFFDVFYVNWNPALFKYTFSTHAVWKSGAGPVKDLYTISANPQYSLEIDNRGSAAVWILLTRHIMDKNDFADNKEYITVLVYKNKGKRVYYPFDPPPFIDGTRINSPHYLCKMVLKEPGRHQYTLVVSQYEKMNTIYYTLRVYSTCEFRLTKIGNPYKHKKTEAGQWQGRTAGGCPNNRDTYPNNPMYQITFDAYENELCIDLKGPKQYSVGFDIVQVNSKYNKPFERRNSGAYRPGFCVLCLENVPGGSYDVIPTTFLAGQEGPYILTVESASPFTTTRVK